MDVLPVALLVALLAVQPVAPRDVLLDAPRDVLLDAPQVVLPVAVVGNC